MNICKASAAQNFDSTYIYKVEEREESEKIICQSDNGLLSIENNELPKVTRYFLKSKKGEPQGYIERKLIQNSNGEVSQNGESTIDRPCESEKVIQHPALYKESQKYKADSHATFNSGTKFYNVNGNSKGFDREKKVCKIAECITLDRNLFKNPSSKNFTLDCTPSNSTQSGKSIDINKMVDTADKVNTFRKGTATKPLTIFCNDPNKRLKNLFTIIRPIEKINENVNFPKCSDDVVSLNKTKDLLVKLIDDELQRVQLDVKLLQNNDINGHALKKLKLECIAKIEDELRLIKRLEHC